MFSKKSFISIIGIIFFIGISGCKRVCRDGCQGIQGPQGEQGIQGERGASGGPFIPYPYLVSTAFTGGVFTLNSLEISNGTPNLPIDTFTVLQNLTRPPIIPPVTVSESGLLDANGNWASTLIPMTTIPCNAGSDLIYFSTYVSTTLNSGEVVDTYWNMTIRCDSVIVD